MNPAALVIFGIMMTAGLIGAANFHDMANQYFAQRSPVVEPLRCPASMAPEARTVIGHTETVFLGDAREMVFDAKVDSGADSSSLHAVEIRTFERSIKQNGVTQPVLYVRFKTMDDLGTERVLEKMVSRIDQVKSASGIRTRYFFLEKLWVHDRAYEVEMNLADRSRLSKKMLVGKNLLNQGYLIDTNKAYVVTQSLAGR
jgi:hypothetical protein